MNFKSIIKIVILALLTMLFGSKAMAYDSPTFTVSASPQTLHDGETTTITVRILNTMDVDIMPTVCYIDGNKIDVYSGFLMPGQSTTVSLPITVNFGGQQSIEISASIIYHEDMDYDTCLPWETVTLYSAGETLPPIDIITPAPDLDVITPVPDFGVITPVPDISIITPAPTPWQPGVITPQPTSAPLPQMADVQADAPQPTDTPIPSDDDNEIIHGAQQAETAEMVVLSIEPTPNPTDANIDMKIAKNRSMAADDSQNTLVSFIQGLDEFTLLCIGLILVFGMLYFGLLIKVKRNKK